MKKKKWAALLAGILLPICLTACAGGQPAADPPAETEPGAGPREEASDTGGNIVEKTLHLSIGDTEVSVAWEDNESVAALIGLAGNGPLEIRMSMYGGFEQVGPLGAALPRNDVRTTTQAGDIVLYSGDQIVLFYGSNTWAYTRLGRITDRTEAELEELLGGGNVTLTITYGG
jgi:hypothetical protein